MNPYRRTFQQHRRLLLTPIIVAAGLALWTVAGAPKSYESHTSLWVDYPPPAPSSLTVTDPSMRTPADQQKLIFDELVKTHGFQVAVARRGPLLRYLQSGPSKGWGPFAMLGSLTGGGGGSTDASINSAFGPKKLLSEVGGPQVLQLSFTANDPVVAANTLRAMVNQYDAELTNIGTERTRSTLSYQQARLDAANKAVASARDRVGRYTRQSPGATPSSDPELRALTRAQRTAASELSRATAALNSASSDLANGARPTETVRVIDAPRVPSAPRRGKKIMVMAMVGGLFAGGLISLLGLIALTPSRPAGWDSVPARDPMAFDQDDFLGPEVTPEPAVAAGRQGLQSVGGEMPKRARVGGDRS